MLITERMIHSQNNILESIEFIHIQPSVATIPIVETNDLYRVDIEDLMKFSEDQGIYDLGLVLSTLCESDKISPDKIVLTVNEVSVLADPYLSKIVQKIHESGIKMMVASLSLNDPLSILGSSIRESVLSGSIDGLSEFVEHFCPEIITEDTDTTNYFDPKQAYEKLLKDAAGDPKLIAEIKKLHDEGWSTGAIRQRFSENPKLHPLGKVTAEQGANLFQNPNNQKAMQKASGIYETRDRHMKMAGKWLADSSTRNDEVSFNKAKQRTLRQLHRFKSHADLKKDKWVNDFQGNKILNLPNHAADIRMHRFTGATDSEVNNRIDSLTKLVQNEQFPKTRLAKMIAWLRSLYKEFMMRHHVYKNANLMSLTGFAKNIAAKILLLIDKLAQKLQNFVNK